MMKKWDRGKFWTKNWDLYCPSKSETVGEYERHFVVLDKC